MAAETAIPKRPSQFDEAVLFAAAERLYPDYAKWCDGIPDDEYDAVIKSLVNAIRYEWDGYKIVSALERYAGIDGDADLVDIMGNAHGYVHSAQDAAERRWVSEYGIKPEFAIGAEVVFPRGSGVIDTIYAERGRYVVRGPKDAPRCGKLVPFEDAKLAEVASC